MRPPYPYQDISFEMQDRKPNALHVHKKPAAGPFDFTQGVVFNILLADPGKLFARKKIQNAVSSDYGLESHRW